MGYNPVPVNPEHLCQYAAFLARSLNPSSIPQYLNIVGILHKEMGLPNPLLHNWPLKSLLTGIRRAKGEPPRQKLPITPQLLLQIHSKLNLTYSIDASFWAICLVAFFGMFRKSHLLPVSGSSFTPSKQLTKNDFTFYPWGMLLTIRWSKTIQFRERVVQIPLPRIPNSPLCPVEASTKAFRFTIQSSSASQAFNWLDHSALQINTFTYRTFTTKLRAILSDFGLSARDYAGHSFRRGGASFAYQSGVPIELIKGLGDWRSDAVLLYLTIPLSIRLQSINMITKSIISTFPTQTT